MRWKIFLVLLYSVATLLFSAPLAFHLADSMFDLGDSELSAWVMSWPSRFLVHQRSERGDGALAPALVEDSVRAGPRAGRPERPRKKFFDANIFYPVARSLLFTDAMLPYQIVFAPAFLLTQNPVLAHNLVFLICLFFSALAMYRLAHYYTRDRAAALVAGLVFGFAPIHFSQPHHVQLQGLLWMPLCMLFLEKWWQRRRYRDVMVAAACFALQTLTSFYVGSFFAIILITWFALRALFDRNAMRMGESTKPVVRAEAPKFSVPPRRILILQIFVALILTGAIVSPYAIGYLEVQRDWGAARTEEENVPFSADLLLSLVGVHPSNFLYGKLFETVHRGRAYEQFLFNGFCVLLLALLAMRAAFARTEIFHRRTILIHAALGAIAFLFALGPRLQIAGQVTRVPLPYKLLADWVPGFSAFRVPARFGLILLLPLSVLAAYGVLALLRWWKRKFDQSGAQSFLVSGGAVTAGVVLLLAIEFLCAPMKVYRVDAACGLPPEYRFLRDEKISGAVLEVPFTSPVRAHQTAEYTFVSILHRRDIVNGYSSFFPSTYFEMASLVERLPSNEALDALSALNVRTLVVHGERLAPAERDAWMRAQESGEGLVLAAKFENGAMIFGNLRRPRVTNDAKNLQLSMRPTEFAAGKKSYIEIEAFLKGRRAETERGFEVWLHPQLPQRIQGTSVDVVWRADERGGEAVIQEKRRISLSPFVNSSAKTFAKFFVDAPPRAGAYTLVLQSEEFGEFRAAVRVRER